MYVQTDKNILGGGELGGRLILTFISLRASCKMLFTTRGAGIFEVANLRENKSPATAGRAVATRAI